MDTAITEKLIHRFQIGSSLQEVRDVLIREQTVALTINGRETTTLLCSPMHLDELVVGFLFAEGMLREVGEIEELEVGKDHSAVRIVLRPPGRKGEEPGMGMTQPAGGEGPVQPEAHALPAPAMLARDALALMEQLLHASQIHRETGGVHTAALARGGEMLFYREDIGRHNAVDKVVGRCLLQGIPVSDKALVLSGRVSTEILSKVVKAGFRCLVSRSAVTDQACEVARENGLILIGFTRGNRFNVYSGATHVDTEGD